MSDSETDEEEECMMYLPFIEENMVIITSTDEINTLQMGEYIIRNKDRLIRKNTRGLLLAGVHGKEGGQIGEVDDNLVHDNLSLIERLQEDLSEKIEEKNASFVLEDIGQYIDGYNLDDKRLSDAINSHNPTLLIFGFCFTHQ